MIMGITKTNLESVWNSSVTGQELFFAVFYSKPALVERYKKDEIFIVL